MKSLSIILSVAITLSCILPLSAQDAPDGFASISGNELSTTTGGEGGITVLVKTLADLKNYAASSTPYIILVNGLIESDPWTEVDVNSNKTIVGYGTDATLKNIELHLIDVENIIIRNLIIRDSYVEGDWDGKNNDNDAIQADNTHHLWIDHCWFTHCGDGLIDLRKACDYVTVSWVHLSNHNKTFGIGWTEETDWQMTIHHCWIDNTNQRNPSFDQGIGHLYNNYLYNVASYGNLSRGNARLVVQNSKFYKVNNPLSISDNGKLFSSGNEFRACTGNNSGNVSEMPFVPDSFYTYTLDATSEVQEIVTLGSGPKAYIGDQYTGSWTKYSLNATVAEGNGTITPEDNDFIAGADIRVKAIPDDGWLFDHWSGNLSGNAIDTVILMDGDKDIFAWFIEDTTATSRFNRFNNEELVSYYFNPVHKTLRIQLTEIRELNVSLFSIDGKMVFTEEYDQTSEIEIPLSGLKKGLYLARFELNGAIETGRLLVY